MMFKNFTLDKFQEDAIKAIENNHSVVVSAATGTGKTLIADYCIDKYLKENRRIIYTAPIKALSNQKFKDFKNDYGDEMVGIMTGDLVINPTAPVIVMTTEIYRNMLLVNDPIVKDISYVVYDEIHYMNDPERGTVWEESIIFSPEHIRFLALSATIPNANEFADWIQTTKKHRVEVVRYAKRAVPLDHKVFDIEAGLTTATNLKDLMSIPEYPSGKRFRDKKRGKNKKDDIKVPSPEDVILVMMDKLPAIVFSFSRKASEEEARKLASKHDFVSSEERKTIIQTYRKFFTPEMNQMKTTSVLRDALSRGVGFHHAGLLPKHKEVVEELFSLGLLKVLFATETFSVGINMPAKTVVFNGLRKFDGRTFRLINSKEYFQLAGRAGRRGIDTKGYVVAIINRKDNNISEFIKTSSEDKDPIISQFALSINTALNLIATHNEVEIKRLLKSNFDYYLKKQSSDKQIRVMASFNFKKKLLGRLNYISKSDSSLTYKGNFARHIYFEELLISEIFTTDLYRELSDTEIIQIIAGIIYEQRQMDHFSFKGIQRDYDVLIKKLAGNDYVARKFNKLSLKRMMALVSCWSNQGSFEELMKLTNLAEGDIVRLFRRIIDMIGQIKKATDDFDLKERLKNCHNRIDRDLVAIEF